MQFCNVLDCRDGTLMDLRMVMFKSDGARCEFPIEKPRVVVGRMNSCDLRIPLSSVSREHCEIRIDGDQVHVRDLGSSNGTFLNDERIEQTLAEPGDALSIGPVVFTLVIDGDPQEIDPVRSLVAANSSHAGAAGRSNSAELVLSDGDAGPSTASPLDESAADSDIQMIPGSAMDMETKITAQDSDLDMDDPISALQDMADDDDDESGEYPDPQDDDEAK